MINIIIQLELDDAKSNVGAASEAEADLYLSTTIEKPTFTHWTWRSADRGADEIQLNTDLPDWSNNAQVLYLAVYVFFFPVLLLYLVMIEDFAIICGVLIFIIRMNYYIVTVGVG